MSESNYSRIPQTDPTTTTQDISRLSRKQRRERSKFQAVSSSNVSPKEQSSLGKAWPNRADQGTFEEGEDFVPFQLSDVDDGLEQHETPIREWDSGKKTYGNNSKKRKSDDMERGDRYGDKRQRLMDTPRKAPWVADVGWESCNNVPELFHREVEAFVKYVSPTPEEEEIRGFIVDLISNAVSKSFPDAKIMPFGSFETKLYLPTGDIDLVIDSDSMAYSDKVTVLRALANTMKRAGITNNVSIIAKAKVPIIKFVTIHGRFSVDISINQVNGITAGRTINQFIGEFPALRALVLIIKAFLGQRGMNEVFTGGLGSYSIVCLAVSFLQMHPKIRRGEIDMSKNMGVLVMEFFELYGCFFNYHEVGISIRNGGSYFNKAQRGWLEYGKSHLLSIEDPGDPSNDVSRGTYAIAKVRATFAGAFGILTSAAFSHVGLISSRREGHYTSLRKHAEPEDMSILSSILGITQETINRRKLVREVYYGGVVHSMLGIPEPADLPHAAGTTSKRYAPESFQSVWDSADGDRSSDDDIGPCRHYDLDQEGEEESRYTRQPPKKRRRAGAVPDYHTVYTTDEDEDGLIAVSNVSDVRDRLDDERSSKEKQWNGRKRTYWLAKGAS